MSDRKPFNQCLLKPSTVFLVLIAWSVFGFLTNNDYNQQWGCIISSEPTLSETNILYSTVALILITLGYSIRIRQIGSLILITELVFWLHKLFVVKGGYAVGLGAVPSLSVLSFDVIALTLRLILIKQLVGFKFGLRYVFTFVTIVMAVKISYFPLQQGIIDEFDNYPEELEELKAQIVGQWTGTTSTREMKLDTVRFGNISFTQEGGTFERTDSVLVSIKNQLISIEGIEEYANKSYLIEFMTSSDATLWNVLPDTVTGDKKLMDELETELNIKAIGQNEHLYIWRLTKDTMICSFNLKYDLTLTRTKQLPETSTSNKTP